jgi:G3E family GTPase
VSATPSPARLGAAPSGATPQRPPVTIVTGFLGSGKTTLLNRLLRDPAAADTAVVINEFGAVALDHLLVTVPSEGILLLANGCICCTVRGDLVDTLAQLARQRALREVPPFRRVLIETTGLADPVPIVQTLATDSRVAPHFAFDGVLALVDSVNGAAQLDAHREAVKQAALADRLVLTKCDLAPPRAIAALERRLARLNPGARRLRAAWGEVAPEAVLGSGVDARELLRALDPRLYAAGSRRLAGARGAARHDRRIRAFCTVLERPVSGTGLATWLTLLASMRGADLLRVKGLVNVEGRPVVVHAVQSVIHEPVELARWPDAERRSRLVFITRGIGRERIERTLDALAFDSGGLTPRGAFDPRAYQRFVALVRNFR